jgi:hypothetical protein
MGARLGAALLTLLLARALRAPTAATRGPVSQQRPDWTATAAGTPRRRCARPGRRPHPIWAARAPQTPALRGQPAVAADREAHRAPAEAPLAAGRHLRPSHWPGGRAGPCAGGRYHVTHSVGPGVVTRSWGLELRWCCRACGWGHGRGAGGSLARRARARSMAAPVCKAPAVVGKSGVVVIHPPTRTSCCLGRAMGGAPTSVRQAAARPCCNRAAGAAARARGARGAPAQRERRGRGWRAHECAASRGPPLL